MVIAGAYIEAHDLWRKLAAILILLAGVVLPGSGRAQQPPGQSSGGLADVGLEALMNMEVSSPGRKEQKLSQTAGAVYVITQEDIRRSGVTSIPEALRMVPGLQVARINASMWAITSRGFNGRFADQMLVLIDGRSIYNNLYSGVYWEQNDVPLEDIERVEVIRGPGATMWGANAVNGVINIITKPARETQDVMISGGGGNEGQGFGSVRYGGELGDDVFYRAYAKYFNEGPFSTGVGPAHDQWDSGQSGGRLDWQISERDSLSVEGDIYRGGAQQTIDPNYPNTALGQPVSDSIAFSGGYGLARWSRRVSDRSDLKAQLSFTEENRTEGFGRFRTRVVDFDFQHHYALSSRHDLMWGFGFRIYNDDTTSQQVLAEPSAVVRFIPADSTQPLASFFAQDQVAILPERIALTLGTKIEHNVFTGFDIQPSAQLIWTPTSRQSLWASVSRAVHTPSLSDRDLVLEYQLSPTPGLYGLLTGNPDFQSETVLSYEAGYRNQPAPWVTVDLATFFSNYSNLSSLDVGAPFVQSGSEPGFVIPMQFGNQAAGHTYGVEIATNWSLTKKWRLTGNYSWFRYGLNRSNLALYSTAEDVEGSSPAHQVQFRSQWDISRKLAFDTAVYYVSALTGIGVPGYVRSDARLAWTLNRKVEISLAGQNLLNGRHREFTAADYAQTSEPGREAYLKVTWIF
jgi:iron complex outermembrane receptor protein